jgi:hypothetical protein
MAINNPFAGKDNGNTAKPAGDTGSADAIMDLFNREDAPEEKKPAKKEEVKDEEKKDEKDEDELELKDDEDESEEKLDLKEKKEELEEEEEEKDEKDEEGKDEKEELEAPPRKKEIEKAYPGIFKKFPFLEKMLYRDKEVTELFGSFDEAKEVASKVERLNEFETELLGGKTEGVLKSVKEADPKAYDKIIDDYIAVLERTDKDAFLDVSENIVKRVIMGMVQAADKSQSSNAAKSKELKAAAQELHDYMFGVGTEWSDPKVRVADKEENKDNELEEERKNFMQERFLVARNDLQSRIDNVLKATISEHIDPKGLMSAYEKSNAVRDTLEAIHQLAGNDAAFKKNLSILWKNAAGAKFNQASLEIIRKNYLGKCKSVAMSAIKKIRSTALAGKTTTKVKDEEDKEETSRERKSVTAGRPAQSTKKANGRKQGESIEEFFGRD